MIDYAIHLLKATDLLKEIYEDCESGRHTEAMEKCLHAITEMKMGYNAIHHYVTSDDPDEIVGVWVND